MKSNNDMFQGYYEAILTYIEVYRPSTKETVEFIGALIYSIIEMIDITEDERGFYVDLYNRLITKKLSLKKSKEVEEGKETRSSLLAGINQ